MELSLHDLCKLDKIDDLVKFLKDHPRIDLDETDQNGYTPLMIAASVNNLQAVELLINITPILTNAIRKSINLYAMNNLGATALDLTTDDKIRKLLSEEFNRKKRIEKSHIVEAYHETDSVSYRLIMTDVRANHYPMVGGKGGYFAGGIYFAKSKEESSRKALHHGRGFECKLRVGNVLKISSQIEYTEFINKYTNKNPYGTPIDIIRARLLVDGYDSVWGYNDLSIANPILKTGDEYVVYSSDQVEIINRYITYPISFDAQHKIQYLWNPVELKNHGVRSSSHKHIIKYDPNVKAAYYKLTAFQNDKSVPVLSSIVKALKHEYSETFDKLKHGDIIYIKNNIVNYCCYYIEYFSKHFIILNINTDENNEITKSIRIPIIVTDMLEDSFSYYSTILKLDNFERINIGVNDKIWNEISQILSEGDKDNFYSSYINELKTNGFLFYDGYYNFLYNLKASSTKNLTKLDCIRILDSLFNLRTYGVMKGSIEFTLDKTFLKYSIFNKKSIESFFISNKWTWSKQQYDDTVINFTGPQNEVLSLKNHIAKTINNAKLIIPVSHKGGSGSGLVKRISDKIKESFSKKKTVKDAFLKEYKGDYAELYVYPHNIKNYPVIKFPTYEIIDLNIKIVEKHLKTKLKHGDIIRFDNMFSYGFVFKNDNEQGYIIMNDYIRADGGDDRLHVPHHITEYMTDAYNFYIKQIIYTLPIGKHDRIRTIIFKHTEMNEKINNILKNASIDIKADSYSVFKLNDVTVSTQNIFYISESKLHQDLLIKDLFISSGTLKIIISVTFGNDIYKYDVDTSQLKHLLPSDKWTYVESIDSINLKGPCDEKNILIERVKNLFTHDSIIAF